MFAELAITLALRATEAVRPTAVLIPPACATVDPVRFPCPPTPGIVVETFQDPLPAVTEDDPGWDCRLQGNRVCGVGSDPVHPESVTVYGVPVDSLDTAHALSLVFGSALGIGSDSGLMFDAETMNRLIDAGAAARAAADQA